MAMPHNPTPAAITLMLIRSKIAITHRLLHSRSDIPLQVVQQTACRTKSPLDDAVNLSIPTSMGDTPHRAVSKW
jgi:hypothetical protein